MISVLILSNCPEHRFTNREAEFSVENKGIY